MTNPLRPFLLPKNHTKSRRKRDVYILGNNINLYRKVVEPTSEINCYNYREITSAPGYKKGSLKINKFSDLMKDWDFDSNNAENIIPENMSALSSKSVHWICNVCGHKWKAKISDRVSHAARCPQCARGCHSSLPEQAIFYYVKEIFPDAINGYSGFGFELDIYIPSIKTAIEYDGEWHKKKKNKSYETDKNKWCEDLGVNLIRVREDKCYEMASTDNTKVYVYKYRDWLSLEIIIKDILISLGASLNDIDVDFQRDNMQFSKNLNLARVRNNLIEKAPDLAEMFDLDKNYPIRPEYVNFGSTRRFHFKCERGHEFYTSPNQITNSNSRHGCPICGKIIGPLARLRPYISEDGELYPTIENYDKFNARSMNSSVHANRPIFGKKWRFLTEEEKEANKNIFIEYLFYKYSLKTNAA